MTASENPQGGLADSITQVDAPYLTSWCGGTGCDNCILCLIFSGKAKLIKADDVSHKLTYRIIE